MPSPAAERGSATITLATVAAVLLLIVAVIAGAVGGITGQEAAACTAQPAASSAAASIPANYLADFKAAGTRYGIPWTVLAAIGQVESGFGANDGPSSAGALGPMQFEPSTWALYGEGGNIMDPADAIPAAARLLVANGAPANADCGSDNGAPYTIAFNIAGGGVKTIAPGSGYATLIRPVTIDGATEPGCSAYPCIELNGAGAGVADGLTISAGSSTIDRLVINRFNGNGIKLTTNGGNNILGNRVGVGSSRAKAGSAWVFAASACWRW